MAVFADPVCLGHLAERVGLRNRELEAPGLDQLADLAEHMERAAGVTP